MIRRDMRPQNLHPTPALNKGTIVKMCNAQQITSAENANIIGTFVRKYHPSRMGLQEGQFYVVCTLDNNVIHEENFVSHNQLPLCVCVCVCAAYKL